MDIKQQLKSLSDKKYQKFSSSLLPNINNILGVRLPVLRKLAKELYKTNNYNQLLVQIDYEYFEEVMLTGMIIGLLKDNDCNVLEKIKKFVPLINNWSICDSFCCGLKYAQTHQDEIFNLLLTYSKSKNEYDLRFCYVMFLNYYINNKYIDKVFELVDNFNSDFYYAKMSVAWCISICYIMYSKKTQKYLKHSKLDNWTYNKCIQKICESYKVSKEDKEKIKQFKR